MPSTAALRAARAGGAAWISSPAAATPAARRRYRWSRIMCPGPQLPVLRTRPGACGSLLAALAGAR